MTDKKFEDEIIKGLQRMSEEDPDGFSADVLKVIERQKAEIERLKADNKIYIEANKVIWCQRDKWVSTRQAR